MKRWLAAVGLVLGLCGGAQAQPVSGGLLGRGASYSGFVAPTGCVSSSVPFFGASVTLGCDGGISYDAATDTLTAGAVTVGTAGKFFPVAANKVGWKNGTNAQEFRVYKTDDGAGNTEYIFLSWALSSNLAWFGSNAEGTGTIRAVAFGPYGSRWGVGSFSLYPLENENQDIGTTTLVPRTIRANTSFELRTTNNALWVRGHATEIITLSTSGTTTDSVGNLLPANSIIEAVVARVTTTITTATDWKLGDATTPGRFTAANSTLTAGTTGVGLVHVDQAGAAGPRQTTAAKLRITTTGTPGAGVIRVTVFYRQFTPPAS